MSLSDQDTILEWLPAHKGELSIAHNEHKSSYETVEDYAAFLDLQDDEWASQSERTRAIETDSLWIVQWYPDTPIGFHRVAASSLEAIKEWFDNDSV